jgi:phosphoenolpyruvate carboxykinase (GTP)
LFGGRRPQGVPLVYEAYNWEHGVFVGASVRSEATAAAEDHGKEVLHDPFAMRPFFGYNFGRYVKHWLTMKEQHPNAKLPKIFHVNWFRQDSNGKFLWPGFGENIRVLDWILKRIDNEPVAEPSPMGLIPKPDAVPLDGLDPKPDMGELFRFDKDFWRAETAEIKTYFEEQLPEDTPQEIWNQIENLRKRVEEYPESN